MFLIFWEGFAINLLERKEVHQVNPIEKGQNTLTDRLQPSWPSPFLQVYRALMDAVVLDWTISLADKDRMKTCAVTYLSKEKAAKATTIQPFMPPTRTFVLENLTPNQVINSAVSGTS